MFLLFAAFIAGILTVLAPCVLPLLPIIVGGSVTGDLKDKKRPLVIAISLAVSIFFFTLVLKVTTLLINIPPQVIAYISGGIIVGLGLAIMFPGFYAKLTARMGLEQASQKLLGKGFNNKNSFIGPIVTGAALGPVFASCSPVYAYILATVLPANLAQALAYMISYILGLAAVMLLIGYYGQQLVAKLKFASDPKGTFQRVLAVIFILVGVMIATGYDKSFQVFVSEHTPFNFNSLSSKLLPSSKTKVSDDTSDLFNVDSIPAPELVGLKDWINSEPQTLAQLKGKVVLLDFWTYSCINCIRNNPHIEYLYKTYKDDGFVVLGIHAPEFSFEKVPANVRKAVIEQKITYPVALDNDLTTWNAFGNRSWPASYLIDAKGNVRRLHEGEGKYVEEEQAVRQLLKEKGSSVSKKALGKEAIVPITQAQTPENYLGKARADGYSGTPALGSASRSNFTLNDKLEIGSWTLGGKWDVQDEKIIARGNSILRFRVSAREVYLVGGSDTPQLLTVKLNGKPISQIGYAGQDVQDSTVQFSGARLYRLVSFPEFNNDSLLELSVPNGVELNAFTFGS